MRLVSSAHVRLFPRLFLGILALGLIIPRAVPAAPPVIPHAQDKPPGPALSPQESLTHLRVPPGFQVELVAHEPDLVNPVAMCFDERGRIWVCESLEYPRRSAGVGRDRVKVFEDTNGDGTADKMTVFAEGLNIPSAIAVGHGGVWVANSPDILFLKDTDGDDRADTREVIVTGFGRTDTHELPNSFTWGPDGWLYGLNGVFNQSHVSHQGREHVFNAAMFRLHPRTHEFELWAEGTSNPWGIALNERGSAFISACVIDHLWHIVQGGYYHRQAGAYPPHTWKIESIVQHKHQKAAYCGITWFDSDVYPAEYRGRLYMGNIHGNCVNVDSLKRQGSTYFATGEPDFLSTDDAWFMPVSQKVAPDGCLYVLDWYDQYHCYQDANRDPEGIERAKGRLYRVRYGQSPRAPRFDLARESDEQLISRLGSPNVYFRETAQRLLVERNTPGSRNALAQLVQGPNTTFRQRMHALWALASNGLEPQVHLALLFHADEAVRAHAVRCAGNVKQLDPAVARRVAELAKDPSPEVRLQVASAVPRIAGLDRLDVLLTVLEQPTDDPLLPRVAWRQMLPEIAGRGDEFVTRWQKASKIPVALQNELAPRSLDVLLTRLASREGGQPIPPAAVAKFLAPLRDQAPTAFRDCLRRIAARIESGELPKSAIPALKTELEPTLAPLLANAAAHPGGLDAALLVTAWGDPRGVQVARQNFTTRGLAPDQRLRALQALVASRDAGLLDAVATALSEPAVVSPRPDAKAQEAAREFPGQVLAALGRLDDPRVAEVVLQAWEKLPPEVQPRAVELLAGRVAWARQLLNAMGNKQIPATLMNQTQARNLLALRDAGLTELVARHWGRIRDGRNPQRDAVIAEFRAEFRKNPGDPVRGQAAYAKVCGQCHKLFGDGAEVGPDLTDNGRSTYDQLLSNVFDPSLVIGAAYQARTVLTTGGRAVTGLVVEDSPEHLVLKVQGGKLETIPRAEIDEEKQSEQSLMPEDVEKSLSRQELLDLFAYITLDRPPTDPEARSIRGLRDTTARDATEPALFGSILVETAPGFVTHQVGERGLGFLRSHWNRERVLRTHPVDKETPCELTRTVQVPTTGQPRLKLEVAHDRAGDWRLVILGNGETLHDQIVGPETAKEGWVDLEIDLRKFAGQSVTVVLQNAANNWVNEFGYWRDVEFVVD